MKPVELTVVERIHLANLINGEKADAIGLRKWFKVLDAIDFDELEKQRVGYQQEGNMIRWNPAHGEDTKEIELEDEHFTMVQDLLKGKKNFNVADRQVLGLLDAFEV